MIQNKKGSLKENGQIGYVYKIINSINGKYYIGSRQANYRTDNFYMGSGLLIKKAIKKYGIQNFTKEILYEGTSFRTKEAEILLSLNSANDLQSYNLKNAALGGSFLGEANGMYGKHLSKETKLQISKNNNMKTEQGRKQKSNAMAGEFNPMYGKNHSTFTKEKIKSSRLARRINWGFLPLGKVHSSIFKKIYKDVWNKGKLVSPRNLKILEIENYNISFPPYVRFTNFASRNFKLNYVKNEFLWYLRGDKFDHSIYQHASMWKEITNEDGSINSNYGQYIFGNQNQFDNVAKILTEDKDSRRAVISILNKDHLFSDTKDVPCTYSMSFRIRDNKLNMSVRMRSMDAIFGFSNDIPCFSFIHEMMFIVMKEVYKDLEYGIYHHIADSFHVYERHFKMLEKLIQREEKYCLVLCPQISSYDEVQFLRSTEFLNNEEIPSQFNFAKWLKTEYVIGDQTIPYNKVFE